MAIVVSIGTFISTLLGGLFALYLQDRLHLILGFSAGALIGVAFFDLLPESLDLTSAALGGQIVATVIATGFVGYTLLDRTIAPHGDKGRRTEKLWQRGALGAGSLSAHSFLDGFAIGLAFKVSAAVGAIVSAAVLAHDFCDGINTVSIILRWPRQSSDLSRRLAMKGGILAYRGLATAGPVEKSRLRQRAELLREAATSSAVSI
jgi:zinc transporter ZupT